MKLFLTIAYELYTCKPTCFKCSRFICDVKCGFSGFFQYVYIYIYIYILVFFILDYAMYIQRAADDEICIYSLGENNYFSLLFFYLFVTIHFTNVVLKENLELFPTQ